MALASVEDCASPNIKIARGGSWVCVKNGVKGAKLVGAIENDTIFFKKRFGSEPCIRGTKTFVRTPGISLSWDIARPATPVLVERRGEAAG